MTSFLPGLDATRLVSSRLSSSSEHLDVARLESSRLRSSFRGLAALSSARLGSTRRLLASPSTWPSFCRSTLNALLRSTKETISQSARPTPSPIRLLSCALFARLASRVSGRSSAVFSVSSSPSSPSSPASSFPLSSFPRCLPRKRNQRRFRALAIDWNRDPHFARSANLYCNSLSSSRIESLLAELTKSVPATVAATSATERRLFNPKS